VLSLVRESAHDKGLVIEVVNRNAPLWLRGDPMRLRQALLNFAGNAVKFTEQGRIDVSAELLREQADELLLRFEVRDTGIGIPPQHQGGCSATLRSPTPPPRASTAARGWGWPSPAGWPS
jgi:two-component system sensor histidine kinase/response regulator